MATKRRKVIKRIVKTKRRTKRRKRTKRRIVPKRKLKKNYKRSRKFRMMEEQLSEIYFNSKSKENYKELSNFYGDVEICYMQKRFANDKMKQLFEDFKTCDNDKFIFYLKLLQPDKKNWNEKKEKYWFNENEPIRGILAKLVGAIVVKPVKLKKRIKVISVYLNISVEEVTRSDKVTNDDDMLECLMKKYSIEKYKQLLLSTGNAILHEKPLRGHPNAWTYKKGEGGGDKLGKMLMGIRDKIKLSEIRDESIPPEPNMLGHRSYNPKRAVEFLNDRGYIVIEIPWMTQSKLLYIKEQFNNTLRQFREFEEGSDDYVMGGFAALGNPSSFHNTLVRTLRMNAMAELIPLFSEYIHSLDGDNWKLEQDIDRMLYRKVGRSPSRESWHRDEAINAEENDQIFGGWINLDTEDQYFSCAPGTHTGVKGHSGFAPISKEEAKKYNKKEVKKSVTIPPGSIMIFYENLVHEVLSKKARRNMYRLFTGWRVTQSNESLIGNKELRKLLDDNAIIPLKSGQQPPMYAKLHWTNWVDNLSTFSKNVKSEFREKKEMKSGKRKGQRYDISQRYMKSLREAGQALYDEYDDIEYNMYIPNRNWILQYGGNDKLYEYNI